VAVSFFSLLPDVSNPFKLFTTIHNRQVSPTLTNGSDRRTRPIASYSKNVVRLDFRINKVIVPFYSFTGTGPIAPKKYIDWRVTLLTVHYYSRYHSTP